MDASPYISLHGNRSWAVFNQMLHEYRCDALGSNYRYRAACKPWTLYALEVPLADLGSFQGSSSLARNMANLSETRFGQLQVRVARHAQVVIPNGLRQASNKWFAAQFEQARAEASGTGKPPSPKYPYRQWLSHVSLLDKGKAWLDQDLTDPVKLWKAGKAQPEVSDMVKAALAKDPVPTSASSSSQPVRYGSHDWVIFQGRYGSGSSCGCGADDNGACMGPPPF